MTTTSGAPLHTSAFNSKPTIIPRTSSDGLWYGQFVKIEQVLFRSPKGGSRLHYWLGSDMRIHNHPWDWITCKIVRGAYEAEEYKPCLVEAHEGTHESLVTRWERSRKSLLEGSDEHKVQHEVYHQITRVVPGTISVMTFGPVVGDGQQWGHLVAGEAGELRYEQAQPMGKFVDALRHCNPHLRPEGWVDPYEEFPVPDVASLVATVDQEFEQRLMEWYRNA